MFDETREFGVIWDGSVLKPLERLDLPAQTRLVVSVRRVDVSSERAAEGRRQMHELRRSAAVRLGGWRPTRDELHERG